MSAGLCSRAHTSLVWVVIVPHSKKKHSSTIPQEQNQYSFVLYACALEIKSGNNLEQSLQVFNANKSGIQAERGITWPWKLETRGRESNNYSVKTFVFSEKGPVQFM